MIQRFLDTEMTKYVFKAVKTWPNCDAHRLIFSVRRISKSKRTIVQKCYIAATRRRRRQIVTENRKRAVSTWHIGRIPISHSMTAAYHPRNPLSSGMEGGFNNNPSGWQDSRVEPWPPSANLWLFCRFRQPPPSPTQNNDMSHVTTQPAPHHIGNNTSLCIPFRAWFLLFRNVITCLLAVTGESSTVQYTSIEYSTTHETWE